MGPGSRSLSSAVGLFTGGCAQLPAAPPVALALPALPPNAAEPASPLVPPLLGNPESARAPPPLPPDAVAPPFAFEAVSSSSAVAQPSESVSIQHAHHRMRMNT